VKIRVKYFAMLAEQANCTEQVIQTNPCSCAQLYEQLQQEHCFSLPLSQLRVVVNEEFTTMDRLLQEDDEVVFIPPVSGG
jgi:molybdopterin converting factor subunit 1